MSNTAWAVLIGVVLVGGAVAFWYVNRPEDEPENETEDEVEDVSESEVGAGLLDTGALTLALDDLDDILEEIGLVSRFKGLENLNRFWRNRSS